MLSMEIQYWAGLFDGEGSITLSKRSSKSNSRYLVLSLPNTHRPVLDLMQTDLGGKVFLNRKPNLEKGHRGTSVWKATTDEAYQILQKLYPYLVIKKDEAEVAMHFQAARRPKNNKGCRRGLEDEELEFIDYCVKRLYDLKRREYHTAG